MHKTAHRWYIRMGENPLLQFKPFRKIPRGEIFLWNSWNCQSRTLNNSCRHNWEREREQLWCALHCSCRSLSDEVGQSLKILSLKICPPIFSKLQLLICSFDKFASEEFFAYFYKLSWHFVSSFFKESALHCLSLLKVWLCSFSEKNISAKLLVKCG